MREELEVGFELDDDLARIDVAEVHRFLLTESYWAKGRPLEYQDRLVREAGRVVGLYHGDRQIGFTRAVSDGIVFAYLADVYVLSEFRGHGLGTAMVRFSVEEGPFARLRWMLHTADAQGLYERFGFGTQNPRLMERKTPSEAARRPPQGG